MKKNRRELIAYLEAHGFTYDRTNTKYSDFYLHPVCGEVQVSINVSETTDKKIRRAIERTLGLETRGDASKRSAATVRERHAAQRARDAAEVEKHRQQIDAFNRQRDALLGGAGSVLTGREVRKIEAHIEREQRALLDLERMMTSTPTNNAHSGRPSAQHRA